jgi:hypothetical protein
LYVPMKTLVAKKIGTHLIASFMMNVATLTVTPPPTWVHPRH